MAQAIFISKKCHKKAQALFFSKKCHRMAGAIFSSKNTQISVNDMNVSVRSFFIISWATCSKMLHIFHGQGAEKCSWYFLLTLVFWLNFFCDMAIFALLHTVPTTLKVVINYPISLTKWMGTYTFAPLYHKNQLHRFNGKNISV